MAGQGSAPVQETQLFTSEQLNHDRPEEAFIPVITKMDISDYHVTDLIAMINKSEIWLLVKGAPYLYKSAGDSKFNLQSVLNRVRYPFY